MEKSLKVGVCDLVNNKKCNKNKALPPPPPHGQGGSLILEAIIVLGMIATFTPMLYKHVADRRADLENINRANTLLYLQQKAEDYLKDPDNVTALVNELGHNQHKEIFPSEMGAGSNFDGRYIVGIRREDENNKPVLKAMIIDTVHTGSDLRAAKVAELIGLSAGIYTAVDPDAAWGINGFWSEPLSRYFDTTDIPTGAVAITTEYNKAKYRMNISDILVDADLDMGEFEVTAEQINAVRIAAENGTLDQLIAQDVRASNKVVAGKKLCVGGEEAKDCIESWEDLNVDRKANLRIVQECDAGMTDSCAEAYAKELNRTCSEVDAVYDKAGVPYPSPKIYTLTYGSGTEYTDVVLTKCEGTSFIVDNISASNLSTPVEQVGDTAFGITTPGWYQITLMGEAGWYNGRSDWNGSGGILVANKNFSTDNIIILKSVKGSVYSSTAYGGAGILLWGELVDTTANPPTLAAGGGGVVYAAGGGIIGGNAYRSGALYGYGWNENLGGNTTICSDATCGSAAASGGSWYRGTTTYGYGGSGSTQSECSSAGYSSCITIMGGNSNYSNSTYKKYLNSAYGNWGTNTPAGGKGYASIVYCGSSEFDCPVFCSANSDCPSDIPYCSDRVCTATKACTASSQCTVASMSDCNNGYCTALISCTTTADCNSVANRPYCVSGYCSASCTSDSQCLSDTPYCRSGTCVTCEAAAGSVIFNNRNSGSYTVVCPGKYQLSARGGDGTGVSCRGDDFSNYQGGQGTGGYVSTSGYFEAGDVFRISRAGGASVYEKCYTDSTQPTNISQAGEGIGIINNTGYIIVAGGGGGTSPAGGVGGGGWIGGGNGCWAKSIGQNPGMHPSSQGCLGGGGSGLSGYSSNGTTAYTLGNARGGAGGTASLSSDGGWTSSANGGTAGSPYGGTGSGVSYQCITFSTGCASYNRKGGGGGGSGYCAPGYSCVADAKGATAATGRVVYCGPSSSSSCP